MLGYFSGTLKSWKNIDRLFKNNFKTHDLMYNLFIFCYVGKYVEPMISTYYQEIVKKLKYFFSKYLV